MLKVKLDNSIFEAKLVYFLKVITDLKYPEVLLDYDYYIFDNISKTDFSELEKVCRERGFFIKHPLYDSDNKESSVYWSEDLNGTAVNKYIESISKACKFKKNETLSRAVVSQLSEFIFKGLGKEKLVKAFSVFESPMEIKYYFESKDDVNSLVFDLLFYYSNSEKNVLLDFFVEILNPDYYVIDSSITSKNTFDLIDGVLSVSLEGEELSYWKKKSLKYSNQVSSVSSVSKVVSTSKPKTNINISRTKGIFCNKDGKDIFYTRLKPSSKVFKSIIFLIEKDEPVKISDLAKQTKQSEVVVKTSIDRVNDNSKRIFDIKYDLIKDAGNGIYFMNKDDYIFL